MRLFVPRDIDGFFGLFVDNLVQLLLIVTFCSSLVGMTGEHALLLYSHILPGAAVSLLVGNVFYAWQAHRLARREGRDDVTALPYGINTPSMIVYVFFVMVPAYQQGNLDPVIAWQMGLIACFGSGVIEFLGSFVAERVRQHTPRAALLSTLAGIAIGFISMQFALMVWHRPLVAMVPMAVVLVTLFSGFRFPLGLPGGLIAIVAGTAAAWALPSGWTGLAMSTEAVSQAVEASSIQLPQWSGAVLWNVLQEPSQWLKYLSVIIPMGLFNLIGSIQNIESAAAAGDKYNAGSSLAVNGAGTILASLFGSCFPTTIYIGHPGWKGLGARAGYSTLNGLVVTALCLTGTLVVAEKVIPIEAGVAILLWIGIIITAQSFQATPHEHAPAVAMGLFPALAAWGATVVMGTFLVAGGATIQELLTSPPVPYAPLDVEVNGYLLHGLIVMERGYIFTCMITAAVSATLIDRRFFAAAAWSLGGSVMTLLGVVHAYQVKGNIVDYMLRGTTVNEGAFVFPGYKIAIGYALMGLVFLAIGVYCKQGKAQFVDSMETG